MKPTQSEALARDHAEAKLQRDRLVEEMDELVAHEDKIKAYMQMVRRHQARIEEIEASLGVE